MTPSRAITDADLRQCSPAAMARELGWPRPPGTVSWSWALLMDVAGRRYALNRAQKADVRMTSAKGSSMESGPEISTGANLHSAQPCEGCEGGHLALPNEQDCDACGGSGVNVYTGDEPWWEAGNA